MTNPSVGKQVICRGPLFSSTYPFDPGQQQREGRHVVQSATFSRLHLAQVASL